jgi:hypothetical protein
MPVVLESLPTPVGQGESLHGGGSVRHTPERESEASIEVSNRCSELREFREVWKRSFGRRPQANHSEERRRAYIDHDPGEGRPVLPISWPKTTEKEAIS